MSNRTDSERLPRQRNRKSDPPCERFEVLSGIDDYLQEESDPIETCPPTLPTGETPRHTW